MKTLEKLAEEKLNELSDETNVLVRRKKVFDYLLQKG